MFCVCVMFCMYVMCVHAQSLTGRRTQTVALEAAVGQTCTGRMTTHIHTQHAASHCTHSVPTVWHTDTMAHINASIGYGGFVSIVFMCHWCFTLFSFVCIGAIQPHDMLCCTPTLRACLFSDPVCPGSWQCCGECPCGAHHLLAASRADAQYGQHALLGTLRKHHRCWSTCLSQRSRTMWTPPSCGLMPQTRLLHVYSTWRRCLHGRTLPPVRMIDHHSDCPPSLTAIVDRHR